MASIFEQYEQDIAASASYLSGKLIVPEMTTTGLINAKLENEGPIFSKKKIDFSPGDNITHMAICKNFLVLAMTNKIRRIDLRDHNRSQNDVSLLKNMNPDMRIRYIHLDLSGNHLLVSLTVAGDVEPLDNIYLFRSSKKPIQLTKMKGVVVSAIAWNHSNSNENSTGAILIGTTKGLIYETELAYSEERAIFQSAPEQYWRQVYDVCANTENSDVMVNITSLNCHKISDMYVVFVTTPSRLFQFMGKATSTEPPFLHSVFSAYTDIPEGFIELPGTLPYSKLVFSYSSSDSLPQTLAWMTEPGVLTGNVSFSNITSPDFCISERSLLSYQENKSTAKTPLSVTVTQFHVLVLFHDRIKIFCTLDEQLLYEDVFTELYGSLLGIVKDPVTGIVWVYSAQAIYRYDVSHEDRNVWQMYLQKKNFKEAKKYCHNDPIKLDNVLLREAEDNFEKKLYTVSAELYAQTHSSFEVIALKFLDVGEEEALKVFLSMKLNSLKPNDKTQITMLLFWLLEIYVNQLGMMRDSGRHHLESYRQLQQEFRNLFTKKNLEESISSNRSSIYKLMTSHGDEENLIYFTILMKDYERVIQYHLQQKDFNTALEVLNKQNNVELFYKFSPALIRAIPRKTVSAWIYQERRLDPVKLIPALVQYDPPRDPNEENEAIRYLEFQIKMGCQDQAIHNYLLAFNARLHPDKLMTYLEMQGQDPETIPYDLKFALRICSDLGLDKACVHIYTSMGLYEEAVDLALKFDIELAKRNADRPEDNEELKKKLWLKIAKHVVEEENDIKRAMKFLQECDLIKIEDILPFFSDFVTIDHFKDAICSSLQEYNQHIETLKDEMQEATESAQEIRMEIQTFRNRFNVVSGQHKCSSCSYPIMSRSFYLFPCRHMFHSDCLIEEVRPHLIPHKQNRIDEIQRQLATLGGRDDTTSISSASLPGAAMTTKNKLNAELDDLVASECVLCGDILIRSIDAPFIPLDQYAEIMKSWE